MRPVSTAIAAAGSALVLALAALLAVTLGSPNVARASEVIPETHELIEFGDSWDVRSRRAGTPGVDESEGIPGDTAARAAQGGWEIGEAPFEGRYGGKGPGKRSTRLDMKGLDRLSTDERSAEERADETVFWFARDIEVEDPAAIQSLLLEARFVGGFVVFVNGEEVMRHRLDMDNRYQAFGEVPELPEFVREGRSSIGQRAFHGIDPGALVAGTNTISVRMHRKPGRVDRPVYFDLRVAAFRDAGFVKGPYLQHATPTSITIMFESSIISTPYIEYGDGTELTESATSPSTGGTLHEVTITGLKPSTRYFYRVRAEKIWPEPADGEDATLESSVYYFHTAPASEAEVEDGWSFLAYGDNRSQPAIHRAVVERMLAEKAAFVLNTGDLTLSGVDYRQWQREFFEPANPLMHYLPLWPSLGNHDGNHISYFEYFSLPEEEAWYSFRYANAEFFALNTVYNLRKGSAQYEWFEAALQASDAEWKIAFFHHPPFSCTPTRLPGFGPVRTHMIPLFESYGVDLVLSGHDHLYAHAEQNGIHYVITGGGGAWSYPVQVEPPNTFCEQVYHYTVVRVEDDALYLRAIDKDGGEVDAFAIRH